MIKNPEVFEYKMIEIDPWLKTYSKDIHLRMERYRETKAKLLGHLKEEAKKSPTSDADQGSSFSSFANGHLFFGFHCTENGWYYREWAPAADSLWLMGDFNRWDRSSHPMTRIENGCWEIFIPGSDSLRHMEHVKVIISTHGLIKDKIPLYIKRCVQNPDTHDFTGVIWKPDSEYKWNYSPPSMKEKPLLIYEAHVGMAQEKEAVGSFQEFTEKILPRIQKSGYNAIQLMAIQQHPYYGSFGYHVSNFFAVSSWFGTPDDLKHLIDTAHGMGIVVLMDLVHSHAVKNTTEGINEFDGSDTQFFHAGERGNHEAWDSKVFNYGKHEVLHFLLSNIKYWIEEYHFDGFRFDGITSMIYVNHGLGMSFDHYGKYFSLNTDIDALCYLQYANELIKELNENCITIAEDMSGMPGMCLPVEYGGIGFDYRLNMGVPDLWIDLIKNFKDEQWNMHKLWHELTTRRPSEKTIGYSESHDQALVGDKTLLFRMADSELYWHMSIDDPSLVIDRAIALLKLLRFLTLTLSGEGYLNFMGNEFGHPEWIDFPRQGNNWSFQYCRRQWNLADAPYLKYTLIKAFDEAMLQFASSHPLLGTNAVNLWLDEDKKIIAYKKGDLLFLFNLHPHRSYNSFELQTNETAQYQVVFTSDRPEFGGHGNVDETTQYQTKPLPSRDQSNGIQIYIPSRTFLVLQRV